VVDHAFRATDPCIFGGGSVAKFSRRYRAPHFLQQYDSREVGLAVAAAVMQVLDPSTEGAGGGEGGLPGEPGAAGVGSSSSAALTPAANLGTLLPKFTQPKAQRAMLPGGFHFLFVEAPDYELGAAGRDIVTHVALEEGGVAFTRLRLDRYDRVVELEYAGTQPVEMYNLASIVGKHAAYLNGLVRKFDAGAIADLVTFFRAEWVYAQFHDRFDALVATLRQHMATDPHVAKLMAEVGTLVARAAAATASTGDGALDAAMAAVRRDGVGVVGARLPPSTRKAVEVVLLHFLRSHRRVLSGYFVPHIR
jgi:hypothetical protein